MTGTGLAADIAFLAGQAAWQAGLVGLLLWLPARLLPHRPASWRNALLGVALVKFAVPPVVALPTGLLPRVALRLESPADAGGATGAVATNALASPWLLVPFLAGTGVVLALLLREAAAWRRHRRAATSVPPGGMLARELARLSERIGLSRPPRFLLSGEAPVPFVIGVRHPAVVLPAAWPERLTPAERALVLGHELAHLRRGDLPWNRLIALLWVAWWWHPVFWLVAAEFRRTQEEACDDRVVAAGIGTAADCSDLLLKAARLVATGPRPGPALHVAAFRLHPLARRLKRLNDGRLSVRRLTGLEQALLAALLLLLLPAARWPHRAPAAATSRPAHGHAHTHEHRLPLMPGGDAR